MFLGQKIKEWFTLIEIMVWILIISILMTGGFYALTSVNIGKIKLIESTNMEKEMFYFSEKLYEIIKKGGLVDYEEYFNRKVYGESFTWGYYSTKSWFWNGVTTMKYCRNMGTGGCFTANNTDLSGVAASVDLSWARLLYGQYSYQFIDYNSNGNTDAPNNSWDEDGVNGIVWDIDDEFIWLGPDAFAASWKVYEVYLINWEKTKRTYFRWNVKVDPNKPSWPQCNGLTWNPSSLTGSWCIWTMEMLKLEWKDWWYDHISWNNDISENDWIIDTWVYDKNFYWLVGYTVADLNGVTNLSDAYWVPLFPDTMSVMNVEFFLFPNKDIKLAWKDFSSNINMTPYLRIKFTLSPSWKKRKGMQWNPPSFDFSTTLSLTDIFSK